MKLWWHNNNLHQNYKINLMNYKFNQINNLILIKYNKCKNKNKSHKHNNYKNNFNRNSNQFNNLKLLKFNKVKLKVKKYNNKYQWMMYLKLLKHLLAKLNERHIT